MHLIKKHFPGLAINNDNNNENNIQVQLKTLSINFKLTNFDSKFYPSGNFTDTVHPN